MGRDLSTIVRDLPITLDLEAARLGDYDRDTVVRLFREYEFRTLIERLPPMAGESAERAHRQRSAPSSTSGYVPAARVAGRPDGWGPGRPIRAGPQGGELQLRLDFDAVVGTPAAPTRRPPADGGRGAAAEPLDDLPTALAAAIVDPGRIEVRGADRHRRARRRGSRRSRGRRVARRRRPAAAPRHAAGARGRGRRRPGRRRRRAPRPPTRCGACVERPGLPLVGHEVKPILVARFADDPGAPTDAGRVRHPDRGVHPQRGAAQPDDRRRRRRAARPDPAAADGAAGHGPGRASRRCPRSPSASRSSGACDEVSLDRLFREIELPLIPVLARMEAVGVALDLEALAVARPRVRRGDQPARGARSTSTSATSSTSAAPSSSSRSCSSS